MRMALGIVFLLLPVHENGQDFAVGTVTGLRLEK